MHRHRPPAAPTMPSYTDTLERRNGTQPVLNDVGRVVCDRCVTADRFGSRFRGLLGRRGLERGEGLLITSTGSIHTMFMRFTIDAVFLDRRFEVVGIAAAVRPWRVAARRRAHHVLELAEGEAARRGVATGQRLSLAGGAAP